MTTPVIKLANVMREYPGEPPVRALAGLDLSIDQGELVGIVGPSGSGKSTLLNVMGTLDRPTSGSVQFEGQELTDLSDRQIASIRGYRIGFVFQAYQLLEHVSIRENVEQGLLYRATSTSERRERAMIALEQVGLAERASSRPSKLSGGQRQRVAIARALVGEPGLVLADEPTGNLDSATSAEIVELLHQLHQNGSTIVVITHDSELAETFPRQVRVRDGLVETDSQPRQPHIGFEEYAA